MELPIRTLPISDCVVWVGVASVDRLLFDKRVVAGGDGVDVNLTVVDVAAASHDWIALHTVTEA